MEQECISKKKHVIEKAVQQIMLGTVCKTETQTKETLSAIKAAGYDGIELNGFMIRPTPFLVRMLTKFSGMPVGKGGTYNWKELIRQSHLKVVSIHEDLGSIQRDPESILQEAQDFQTDTIVITGMYRFDYSDREAVSRLAQDLNKAGAQLKQAGIQLLYHNHNCEFRKIDGMYRFDYSDREAVSRLAQDLNKAGAQLKQAGIQLLYHNHNCEFRKIDAHMTAYDFLIQAVSRLAQDLNKAGAQLKQAGIQLLYHNHNCEFRKIDAHMTAYDFLIQETDPDSVGFEFDSYWPTEAGISALQVMKQLGNRMKLYHINDRGTRLTGPSMTSVGFEFDSYWPTEAGISALQVMKQLGNRMKLYHINDRGTRLTGPSMTPILKSDSMELGCGNMDLKSLLAQAVQANVSAIILESHKNWIEKSPIKSLQKSAEFLHDNL